jgi:bifunctional UDP-N-acetylglucosamine pyrophosphorylase/glucosamine-1-phosphate N-acetyltransferase
VERVLRAGDGAQAAAVALVVSPDAAQFARQLGEACHLIAVVQDAPRGTGDAVRLALEALPAVHRLVVLYGDHPLLESSSVAGLVRSSRQSGAKVTILSAILPDAAGYGRVVRGDGGHVTAVVERRDDDPVLRQGPTEINSGMMVLDAAWARAALAVLQPSMVTGELYLTDLVAVARDSAESGAPWPVAAVAGSPDDAVGVNDRADLALAESRAWARNRERLMEAGVTMRLPETIVIDEDVAVGADTVILPHSQLTGTTAVGAECVIGPGAVIRNSRLGDRVIVRSSTVEESIIADDSDVGPYAHLRAGSEIGPRVHIGNFAEIKAARLAPGVKVGHFSYIGDATVGAETNVGAGTITANFDGERKHRTEIGERAFIGSDTILRAPVRIGDGARTGAGSVVTKDVPAGATVVGMPARRILRGTVRHNEKNEEA